MFIGLFCEGCSWTSFYLILTAKGGINLIYNQEQSLPAEATFAPISGSPHQQ